MFVMPTAHTLTLNLNSENSKFSLIARVLINSRQNKMAKWNFIYFANLGLNFVSRKIKYYLLKIMWVLQDNFPMYLA